MTEINGTVQDGYGKVADAFGANFDDHGELGAAFALYVDGDCKVDVWAGVADKTTGRAWEEDTLQLVFSTTKGAAAVCVAQLVEAGKIDYDAPVASYWPEFAAEGKDAITVCQLLSHQGGLPYVDAPLTFDDVLAVDPVVAALAAQKPVWVPGSTHGYHALTYGWLAGELVRRVDGRRIGQYFAEEVAARSGSSSGSVCPSRRSRGSSRLEQSPPPSDPAVLELMMSVMGPGTNGFKALTMNGALNGFGGESPFNSRAVHATEMPAANGITTARSLARMYAATVSEVDGVRLIDDATVKAASAEQVNGPDELPRRRHPVRLRLHAPRHAHADAQRRSFGHAGAGGSLGYADPDAKVGYGYVMNQMGGGLTGDPRTIGLTSRRPR